MQQNQRKSSLKSSLLGTIIFLLAFSYDQSSSYATSNIFILDNSGSMGCAPKTKFSDKVDGDRCKDKESIQYPVDIARQEIINQVNQLSSSNSEVALIEMGGITKFGDKECKANPVIPLIDITSFKKQLQSNYSLKSQEKLIIPNHSGSTATGKALRQAWDMVKSKPGQRRLVIITDGASNCNPPKLCDVINDIDKQIKDAPDKFKVLKEIRILYGFTTEVLNEDSIKNS